MDHACPVSSAKDKTAKLIHTESLSTVVPSLFGFAARLNDDQGIPFSLIDYLELVDWSGRAIHPQKKSNIAGDVPPILVRLGIAPDQLLRYLSRQEQGFAQVIGKAITIRSAANQLCASFLKGIAAANRLFPQLN